MTHSSNQRSYSRFIPREELGDVVQWKFGAVDGSLEPVPVVEPEPVVELPIEIDEEAIRIQEELLQQVREEAYAQGLAQGQAQTAAEWQGRLDDYVAHEGQSARERLEQVFEQLGMQLQDMQQTMAQQVLELACDVARQVVRQELQVNANALLPVVKEAVQMLVVEGKPATVRLHPQDLQSFDLASREAMDAPGVQWVGDASVALGGCLVESAGTVVDASLQRRWERAIDVLGLQSPWNAEAEDAV